MILASIGECFGGNGWLVFVIFVVIAARQWGKILKGNTVLRGAAKDVFLSVFGRIFK